MPAVVERAFTWLFGIERGLLALLLTAMVLVAALQVILRNFFDSGLYWGDSAVRVAVLWVAMIGAMVASRSDEHIRIDLVNHFLGAQAQAWVKRVVNLFTCIVLGIFAWTSLTFFEIEYEDQTQAFAAVPVWLCVLVIPATSSIMALRYALQVIWPKT